VYRPRVSELEMRRKTISSVIQNLFRGNPSEVVGQILSERDVSEEDLARMKKLIRDARAVDHRKKTPRQSDVR
jgi:predicted transcriptional regulator